MFLTPPELSELTGLRRPSAVCRWLDRQRIPFIVRTDGWPRVLRSVIIERLGGHDVAQPHEPELILE